MLLSMSEGGGLKRGWRRNWLCSAAFVLVAAMLCLAPLAQAETASWSFEPVSWDFGVRHPEAGPSPPKSFTLTNTGEIELSVGFVSIGNVDGAGFAIAGNSCGTLSPLESCAIDVTFDPETAGPQQGGLSVADIGGPVAPASVQLSGTGAGPAVSIAPGSLDFGARDVGAAPSPGKTFVISNDGQLDLSIFSLSIVKRWHANGSPDVDQFGLIGGTCAAGSVIPPGGSCSAELAFSPTLAGYLDSQLWIVDNAPGSPHVATVEGIGIAPPFELAIPPRPPLPRTTIFHRPQKRTHKSRAAFWFRGSATATRFLCRLDDRFLNACSSPARYERLGPGPHRFAVRAIDGNGRSGPAVSYRWRVRGSR